MQTPTLSDYFWGIVGAAIVAGLGAYIWMTKVAWMPVGGQYVGGLGSGEWYDRVHGDDVRWLAVSSWGIALALHAHFVWRRHRRTWRIGEAMLIAGGAAALGAFFMFTVRHYVF
jgi:hypothetical protein